MYFSRNVSSSSRFPNVLIYSHLQCFIILICYICSYFCLFSFCILFSSFSIFFMIKLDKVLPIILIFWENALQLLIIFFPLYLYFKNFLFIFIPTFIISFLPSYFFDLNLLFFYVLRVNSMSFRVESFIFSFSCFMINSKL